jgi:hypothetical protein
MFLHNLLNVLVQIANKMGLQKKMITSCFCFACLTTVDLRLHRDGMSLTYDKESHVCHLVQTEAAT